MPQSGPSREHQDGQAALAAQLGETGFALSGSLVKRMTACGNPGCRCGGDPPQLHGPYLTWTRAVGGKTVTRKITEDQQQRYQAWFDNARRLHELVRKLESLSLAAFEEAEGKSTRS
ncbi:MAG: DUF6788 family protein [Candidatus Dormibacteria bacterium]